MPSNRLKGKIRRDLYTLDDENNPRGSGVETVLPRTILDQVYDDQSPTEQNLRQILENLHQEIITGGRGNIKFPVTTVNGMTDDVVLNKKHLGLNNVDNTSDIDKPLSSPQRNEIMKILKGYDFKVNLDDIYSHIDSTNNPHDVTLEQLNKNDDVEKFVKHYIGLHNTSQNATVHADLRGSLRRLWVLVDEINGTVEERIENVLEQLDDHLSNDNAHINLFNKKENLKNKVIEFTSISNVDQTKYPTTRAVVEYVANKLVEFNESLPDVKNWIEDITVIDKRSSLPRASENTLHKAYFIRYGNESYPEIAICRLNPNNITYDWDISNLSSYSKYNENQFEDTPNGLSLKMQTIVDYILDKNGVLDSTLSEVLEDYYKKEDINSFNFINKINMLPGTTDGSIRFYVNNNILTMSDDIYVAGLKRLAYLEWVTDDIIKDNAIIERHIGPNAIARKHIQTKAVIPNNIECPIGYIIGNDTDAKQNISNAISLEKLANYLRPLIGGWPDPTVPGGNPWYDRISIQLLQTHLWIPNAEYDFGNGAFGVRFKGTISCLPNTNYRELVSENITTATGFQMMDAGGTWMYQSSPDIEWAMLGGSNITGHTFGTIIMDKNGMYFESISTGNRIDAPYDIWVRYVKTEDLDKFPAVPPFIDGDN